MLAAGEVDALLAYKPPRCFRAGAPKVARLFPDWEAREKDYFARTGIFPIMHPIGVRKSLLTQHPWLAANLFAGIASAKALEGADPIGGGEVRERGGRKV